jgi:hypothetical protein
VIPHLDDERGAVHVTDSHRRLPSGRAAIDLEDLGRMDVPNTNQGAPSREKLETAPFSFALWDPVMAVRIHPPQPERKRRDMNELRKLFFVPAQPRDRQVRSFAVEIRYVEYPDRT